jgi:hypothetical protein
MNLRIERKLVNVSAVRLATVVNPTPTHEHQVTAAWKVGAHEEVLNEPVFYLYINNIRVISEQVSMAAANAPLVAVVVSAGGQVVPTGGHRKSPPR